MYIFEGAIAPGLSLTKMIFDSRFRDECLTLEWFRSRQEARVVIETWRWHDNAVRPHRSPGYLTPNQFQQQHHHQPNRAIFRE